MCTVEWPIPLGVCAWIHAVSGFLMLCVVLVSIRCNGSQRHIYIWESALELELRPTHRSRKSPVLWCRKNWVFLSRCKKKFSLFFLMALHPLGDKQPYMVVSMGILLQSDCFLAAGDIWSHSVSCFHAVAVLRPFSASSWKWHFDKFPMTYPNVWKEINFTLKKRI